MNAEGKCYVCRRTIHISDFEAGHNKAKSKGGGDTISNLRPICRMCNSSMNTQSIETFKAKHYSKPKKKVEEPKKRDDLLVALEMKVRKYLSGKEHEVLSRKYGFDICALRQIFLSPDSYIVVGYNQQDVVTAEDVRNFLNKTAKFYDTISAKSTLVFPEVQGLIAYTGELPKNIASMVRGFKPPVKCKKF